MVRNIEKNEYFNTKRKKLENKISNVEKRINKINSLENIPLGGNQKARYLSWNEFAKSPEGIKLTVIPYKDEKDYLVKHQEILLNFMNLNLTLIDCKEYGHIERNQGSDGFRTSYTCDRCHLMYNRPMSSEEHASWQKMLKRPMDI